MKYSVAPTIQVEANEDNTSVTGKVNGVNVSAVIPTRTLPTKEPERRKAIDEALVDALLAQAEPGDKPEALEHIVERN